MADPRQRQVGFDFAPSFAKIGIFPAFESLLSANIGCFVFFFVGRVVPKGYNFVLKRPFLMGRLVFGNDSDAHNTRSDLMIGALSSEFSVFCHATNFNFVWDVQSKYIRNCTFFTLKSVLSYDEQNKFTN